LTSAPFQAIARRLLLPGERCLGLFGGCAGLENVANVLQIQTGRFVSGIRIVVRLKGSRFVSVAVMIHGLNFQRFCVGCFT
jgi:hypothetical protein